MGTPEQDVIVVGIDGSDLSKKALGWAARQAELTGAVLHMVTAWHAPPLYGWGPTFPYEDFEQTAKRILSHARDLVRGDSRVRIRDSVTAGNPAQVLIDASHGATLLAVGSRGHGVVAGMLLGSVSQYCVHYAHCPVVVVR